ncbi:MAG: glycoside hydrolase family 88/105 protein [Planctomycetota bacterium]
MTKTNDSLRTDSLGIQWRVAMRVLSALMPLAAALVIPASASGAEGAMSRDAIEKVGLRAAGWSLANQMDNMSYQNMCAAYGILKIAAATGDETLRKGVEEAFRRELLEGAKPHRDNARNRPPHQWFGFVPLELYKQTRNPEYLRRGIELAEEQYRNADENGMPAYTARGYVDDIYGATTMQSLAYACTGEEKYLERAVRQVLFYAEHYQEPSGLFHHGPKSPFYWGRGNGWCAAAFPEVLAVMPEDHPRRDEVLAAYRLMMDALVKYQGPDGMWYQLVDDHHSWPETSCTAMFLFAMAEGGRHGWLSPERHGAAVAKAWPALAGYVDQQWRLQEICVGTGVGRNRQHYLDRPRHTGDAHGQAPLLWAVASLIEASQP